ncbi:MAG: hypothetical protein V1728_05890 [Candidatus Micrarchaeota archaeon]
MATKPPIQEKFDKKTYALATLFFLALSVVGIWEAWNTNESGVASTFGILKGSIREFTRSGNPSGFYLVLIFEVLVIAFMLLLAYVSARSFMRRFSQTIFAFPSPS